MKKVLVFGKRAIKIASLTEDLIAEKKKISDVLKELEDSPEKPIVEEVKALRLWILKEYTGKVLPVQEARLDESIAKRLRNTIDAKEFRKTLDRPQSKGGLGFSMRTMQHISDRLESALSLGHADGILNAKSDVTNKELQ
jgi:hypothetical protein